LYQNALNIYEYTLIPEHPIILEILEEYAILLHKMKAENRAQNLEEQIRKIGLGASQI
jgi:hypothetical protein